jgi:hypothetical protein
MEALIRQLETEQKLTPQLARDQRVRSTHSKCLLG